MWTFNGKKTNRVSVLQVRQRANQALYEKQTLASFTKAYELFIPPIATTPFIVCSPHSGRHYPPSFLKQTQLPLEKLRMSEDSYIDQLLLPLDQYNLPILHALFPRCYVDVNRSSGELPADSLSDEQQHLLSPRARAGLGVIPTCIAQNLNIYPYSLTVKQVQARLDRLYHPYHTALKKLINHTKVKFGRAIVLDFHSMPGKLMSGQTRADFILGDQYGSTCHPKTINLLHNALSTLGYSVVRNTPYAGGFITQHYGQPYNDVEVIQIEINKDLYLNPRIIQPHAGMDILQANINAVILGMIDNLSTNVGIAAQ